MGIVLTENDQREISRDYPALNCSLRRRVIWGSLAFGCSYDSETKEIIYENISDSYIKDCYEVRIDFSQQDVFGFPKVFEESEIIINFAQAEGIKFADLHINKDDDDSCCLGIFPEYKWAGASAFVRDKVVPFFYWQSYRRVHGKEPWKAYAHGDLGLIDALRFPEKEVAKNHNRNKRCPCGSSRKYKQCCFFRDSCLKAELNRRRKIRVKQGTFV